MGTFMGHVIPGTFFLIFGIWWTIRISYLYYSKLGKKQEYTATATFPIQTRWGLCQIEGFFKIFAAVIGIIGECVTGTVGGRFVYIGNGQHATMFFFFGFSGVVDLLMYYKFALPKNSDYIALLLAGFVEGLLFKFHLHGRQDLDVQLHTLLVYTIFISCIVVLGEMSRPSNVLLPYGRAFLTILQGTWFYQLAFILYNPLPNAAVWDGDDHSQIMLTTIIFAWHMMVIFMFMLTVALACGWYTRRRSSYRDEVVLQRLIDGRDRRTDPFESESEVEFQTAVTKS